MDIYAFQVCQKIVVFSQDRKSILLCKRKGEADYDGVFSFIGGKMEAGDTDLVQSLKREKSEEAGESFVIRILPTYTVNLFFVKKDGSRMILPHYYALHESGEVVLNDEYSEYQWVAIDGIDSFEPKIPTIPDAARQLMRLQPLVHDDELVRI